MLDVYTEDTMITMKYTMDSEIIIICLPPITSHALQLLDVVSFGNLLS